MKKLIKTFSNVILMPCVFALVAALAIPSLGWAQNQAPVAIATADKTTVEAALEVCFDGSQSHDPDGDPLQYFWLSDLNGSPDWNTLLSRDVSFCRAFSPPGIYTVWLVVRDYETQSLASVTITVIPNPNPAPVAYAGPDRSGKTDSNITLQGTAVDPNGLSIVYWAWNVEQAPPEAQYSLQGAGSSAVTLRAHTPGDYVLSLVAGNGTLLSSPDLVTIHLTVDTPPIANAGPDMTAIVNQSFTLDGTASYDPDGDPILYWNWQAVSVPAGAASPLKDSNTPTPLFTGTVTGDYILSLSVFDGQFWSAQDFVTVTVVQNQPPVAVISATPTSGTSPLTVQFDGTQSYDPEGGALLFYWQFGDGGVAASPTVSHTYDMPRTYEATLTVRDELGAQDQNTILITVLPPSNQPPLASPTATPNVGQAPLTVQFAANASDPDGDPLTYAWTFGDGGTSAEANPAHVYTQAGDYVAWLTVSDGQASVSASLVITVSSDLTITVQRLEVTYQGNKSTLASVELTANFAGIYGGPLSQDKKTRCI